MTGTGGVEGAGDADEEGSTHRFETSSGPLEFRSCITVTEGSAPRIARSGSPSRGVSITRSAPLIGPVIRYREARAAPDEKFQIEA